MKSLSAVRLCGFKYRPRHHHTKKKPANVSCCFAGFSVQSEPTSIFPLKNLDEKSRIANLRLWKIVPDVTENFFRHPEHFQRTGVSASVETLTQPHAGQNGLPLLAENRTRWNTAKASSSDSRRT